VPHFSVYHLVIKGYCSVGKVENAAQTMSQMLDLGVIPHVESCNSVIRSMCNDEDNIEALLLPLVTGSLANFEYNLNQDLKLMSPDKDACKTIELHFLVDKIFFARKQHEMFQN
jgi:pentatricopeptide repeat protein